MRYVALGRPPSPSDDVSSCFPSHLCSSVSEFHQLAGKGWLHTIEGGTVLLVRQPTSQPPPDSQHPVGRAACLWNHEPISIYVRLLVRPWVMEACSSTASCHFRATPTLPMLKRFYWWIGMCICTRWWLYHGLNCPARKTSRLTVRWPIISVPRPNGPYVPSASIRLAPSRTHLDLHPALHRSFQPPSRHVHGHFFLFLSHFYVPASGQPLVPFSPPVRAFSFYRAHRVQHSHCSSTSIECCCHRLYSRGHN